jgi:hypothetical protein
VDSGLITTENPTYKELERKQILKIALFASIGIIALALAACSKDHEEKSPTAVPTKAKFRNSDKSKLQFHSDMETSSNPTSGSPVLESLKNNHLEVSSTKTIGEAFDSYKYSINKEWRETPTDSGPYYIDYIGWFHVSPVSSVALREGVIKRGMEIKFAVHEDGETYIAMASRVDIKSDGMRYTTPLEPAEIKKTVTAIYENREIAF